MKGGDKMHPDQMDQELKSILSQKQEEMPPEVAEEIQNTLDNLPKKKTLREKIKNRFYIRRGIGIAVLSLLLVFMAGFASQHILTLVNENGEEIFRIEEFNGENKEPTHLDLMREVRNKMELGEVKHIYINDPNDEEEERIRTVTKPKHYGSLMQLKSHVNFLVRTPSYIPEGYDFSYGTMSKRFNIDHDKIMAKFKDVASDNKGEVIVIDGRSEGTPDGTHLNFENANQEVITLRQWHKGPSKIFVSNLKEYEGSKLKIHDMDAIYRKTESYQEILWKDGLSLFEIYTTVHSIDKEELINIAKSMY